MTDRRGRGARIREALLEACRRQVREWGRALQECERRGRAEAATARSEWEAARAGLEALETERRARWWREHRGLTPPELLAAALRERRGEVE